jgi:hypothetical protein
MEMVKSLTELLEMLPVEKKIDYQTVNFALLRHANGFCCCAYDVDESEDAVMMIENDCEPMEFHSKMPYTAVKKMLKYLMKHKFILKCAI